MGRASLAVFSAHLVLCLTLLATVGDDVSARSGFIDAMLLVGSFVTLYAVAQIALRRSKDSGAGDTTNQKTAGAPGAPALSQERRNDGFPQRVAVAIEMQRIVRGNSSGRGRPLASSIGVKMSTYATSRWPAANSRMRSLAARICGSSDTRDGLGLIEM
jgi:hypothetical protein